MICSDDDGEDIDDGDGGSHGDEEVMDVAGAESGRESSGEEEVIDLTGDSD